MEHGTKITTRFAPSPTGAPHLGNIRTAIFTWLFARSRKGRFLLRIEDTDKSREVRGAVEAIVESLEWLGIDYDECQMSNVKCQINVKCQKNLIFQSQRLDIYQKYAQELVEKGHAYVCVCSPERLRKLREEQTKAKQPPMYDGYCRNIKYQISNIKSYVIRLKVPQKGQITFKDIIRGKVSFENKLIDDQVLLKSDGFPTYHLANVVDDHLMGITHVIRAEEWLSSTPKHLLLYKCFDWDPPQFAHLPMILGKDKNKLSKRHGAVSLLEYKAKGYLPEAMFNYLVLLGWHPKDDQEVFSRDELIREFSLDRVQKSPAIFDQEKLDWINGWYLRQLSPSDLLEKLLDYGEERNKDIVKLLNCYIVNDDKTRACKIVKLVQGRMRTLSDFAELSKFIVQLPDYDSELLIFKKYSKQETKNSLEMSLGLVNNFKASDFNQENLSNQFKQAINAQGLKIGEVLHPLRVALTGLKNSPGPFETAEVLGKEESIRRLKLAFGKI
jgi:glutamyl-tRNA synthetase